MEENISVNKILQMVDEELSTLDEIRAAYIKLHNSINDMSKNMSKREIANILIKNDAAYRKLKAMLAAREGVNTVLIENFIQKY